MNKFSFIEKKLTHIITKTTCIIARCRLIIVPNFMRSRIPVWKCEHWLLPKDKFANGNTLRIDYEVAKMNICAPIKWASFNLIDNWLLLVLFRKSIPVPHNESIEGKKGETKQKWWNTTDKMLGTKWTQSEQSTTRCRVFFSCVLVSLWSVVMQLIS